MKTPEEINCGMECIRSNASRICIKPENGQCPRCEQLVSESLGRIQQLESRLAQVERERDAFRPYVEGVACEYGCTYCKHYIERVWSETCFGCNGGKMENWEWNGRFPKVPK